MSPNQIATRTSQVRAEWTPTARAQRFQDGLRRRNEFLKLIASWDPPCGVANPRRAAPAVA